MDALAKENYKTLSAKLSRSEAQIRENAKLIQSLDSTPGADLAPLEPTQYIRPEAWVAEVDAQLQSS